MFVYPHRHPINVCTLRRSTTGVSILWTQQVLSLLGDTDTACLTITGEPGIGKTERALQACHYMRERNIFSAVFFARCRNEEPSSCPFPTSRKQHAYIERLCQLVSEARGFLCTLAFFWCNVNRRLLERNQETALPHRCDTVQSCHDCPQSRLYEVLSAVPHEIPKQVSTPSFGRRFGFSWAHRSGLGLLPY